MKQSGLSLSYLAKPRNYNWRDSSWYMALTRLVLALSGSSVASALVLHCLKMSHKLTTKLIWANVHVFGMSETKVFNIIYTFGILHMTSLIIGK